MSEYHRCVILNDLQRELSKPSVVACSISYNYAMNTMVCWKVFYKQRWLGSIYKARSGCYISVDRVIMVSESTHVNFMEALAAFVDTAELYQNLEMKDPLKPVEMKPEPKKTGIIKTIKGWFK